MSDPQRHEGREAWQAYNAMQTTKQRHFDFLTLLETKKKNFNLDPSEQDRELLKNLLQDHDEQVSAFTDAAGRLKSTHPDTHLALFKYIGELNEILVDTRVSH